MTNAQTLAVDRPLARKRDSDATRAAILAAAKDHFARSGYEGAFLRDIAADAGADAALINRYFGGKDGLFAAALKDSIRPDAITQWDRKTFGRDLCSAIWETNRGCPYLFHQARRRGRHTFEVPV